MDCFPANAARVTPQARRRGNGFYHAAEVGRCVAVIDGTCVSCAQAIRIKSSSSQYRAGYGTEAKKGATRSADLTGGSEAYEQLRSNAVECGLEVGMGMSLFLRRGFVGWLDVWSEISHEDSRRQEIPVETVACDFKLPDSVCGEVVGILAGMVLNRLRQEVA